MGFGMTSAEEDASTERGHMCWALGLFASAQGQQMWDKGGERQHCTTKVLKCNMQSCSTLVHCNMQTYLAHRLGLMRLCRKVC
jgi:hypothetical protein